jgi:hypothetical protein
LNWLPPIYQMNVIGKSRRSNEDRKENDHTTGFKAAFL